MQSEYIVPEYVVEYVENYMNLDYFDAYEYSKNEDYYSYYLIYWYGSGYQVCLKKDFDMSKGFQHYSLNFDKISFSKVDFSFRLTKNDTTGLYTTNDRSSSLSTCNPTSNIYKTNFFEMLGYEVLPPQQTNSTSTDYEPLFLTICILLALILFLQFIYKLLGR